MALFTTFAGKQTNPRHKLRQEHSFRAFSHRSDEQNTVAIGLSWRHLVLLALALSAVTWLAYQIIADSVARHTAISNPSGALAWNSSEAQALDELAQQCLTEIDGLRSSGSQAGAGNKANNRGNAEAKRDNTDTETNEGAGAKSEPVCIELDQAADFARRALSAYPLDSRAIYLLGMIAERKGDATHANALMRLAGARSWHDNATHAWLFQADGKRGDFAGALTHIDAILRTDRSVWERVFPALAAFTVDRRAMQALVAFLDGDPPWRGWFLNELSRRLANIDQLVKLYQDLRLGKVPLKSKELQPYLLRLIVDARFTDAYRAWQETLTSDQSNGDVPYNGNFIGEPNGLPFDWVLLPMQGADIKLVTLPDAEKGRALRLEFSGARVDFHNVTQLTMLSPGTYRLSGMMKSDELRTRRGLWWRISCASVLKIRVSQALTFLGHAPLLVGTVPWQEFGVDFTVPEVGCPAQWLTLELPARIGPERQIEGTAWFKSLRISRIAENKNGSMCVAPNFKE